ncbi:uncharacterized protein LOC120129447 [Hibiscus syriacus]|uniref:uncharacterized protein LOC120129447 n=1 Tax=Hibiscus syriacus TaxID=106335 RepID=UPI001922C765|nr:uncharacterized protein LOC120129447 [Hibiscus syriacus]
MTVSTKVLWNGAISDSFIPSRGIRHDDPLSLYLFVLSMEWLAQAIQKEVDDGNWKPIRLVRNGPCLSHLFFADDLVLFTEASLDQLDVIQRVLKKFCYSSGHKFNHAKTHIFFSHNVDDTVFQDISEGFNYSRVDDLGRYLGVLLLHKRVTKKIYDYLIQKARDRLAGWKVKSLSFAGRIMLAKSVLNTLPTYAMQTSYLPKGVCEEIERLTRNFIWGHSDEKRGINLVSWDRICMPIEQGGLGVQRIVTQNEAFLMRLGYKLLTNEKQLWARVLRTKYKWGGVIPDLLARPGCSRRWDILRALLPDEILLSLPAVIPPRLTGGDDRPRWKLEKNHQFTIASAYNQHLGVSLDVDSDLWKTLSRYKGLPRVSYSDVKQWILTYLSDPEYFPINGKEWDLLFGLILWCLWTRRNKVIFDSGFIETASILQRGRRLCEEAFRAHVVMNGFTGSDSNGVLLI